RAWITSISHGYCGLIERTFMIGNKIGAAVLAAVAGTLVVAAPGAVTAVPPPGDKRPTLFIVGDSTVKNGTKGQMGWGEAIAKHFDKDKIKVANHAIGGRSSRTFQTEGRWDKILAAARPGDLVLIQMGHNDGGPLDDAKRARGSLRGTGEETREIDNPITRKK